jgi:hypothetical protein
MEQDRPPRWLDLIHQGLSHAVDPKSADFMNWRGSGEAVPQQPYYNSYVMHPMLLATIEHLAPLDSRWASLLPEVLERAQRYAAVQEQLISPEGTYPVLGRSTVYRTAAFQSLAEMACRRPR